ncbi:MAG: hypothetical protein EPN37_14450 [Chitinophagaceae bacterium]|nr:MAG: hypothetical protein EPN37_14450 [Chitinophagaceae bacterium]
MKKIMNTLMLSCKKASALIIKRNDFLLTRKERIQLFFHLLVCDACHTFSRQNEVVSKVLEQQNRLPSNWQKEMSAVEELKEQIISGLK